MNSKDKFQKPQIGNVSVECKGFVDVDACEVLDDLSLTDLRKYVSWRLQRGYDSNIEDVGNDILQMLMNGVAVERPDLASIMFNVLLQWLGMERHPRVLLHDEAMEAFEDIYNYMRCMNVRKELAV